MSEVVVICAVLIFAFVSAKKISSLLKPVVDKWNDRTRLPPVQSFPAISELILKGQLLGIERLKSSPLLYSTFEFAIRSGMPVRDKKTARNAVEVAGEVLAYLSPHLQNDLEIVRIAVASYPLSLAFASWKPKRDPNVCSMAVIADSRALEWVEKSLRSSPDFVESSCQDIFRELRSLSPEEAAFLLTMAEQTNGPEKWLDFDIVFADLEATSRSDLRRQALKGWGLARSLPLSVRNLGEASITVSDCVAAFPSFRESTVKRIISVTTFYR